MKRPRKQSSSFFHPLDIVLGSVGAVRVLREMVATREASAPSELALRTGLQRAGVGITLHRLAAIGVLAPVGPGRRPRFRLHEENPLGAALTQLFEAERQRADSALSTLREAVTRTHPAPSAAWLVGSTARGTDGLWSDVDVIVVGKRPNDTTGQDPIDLAASQLMSSGIAVSILWLPPADVARLREAGDARWLEWARDAVVLHGPGPNQVRADGAK